ncbi:hypothetical protein AgCh_007755 [Apium graveolens]
MIPGQYAWDVDVVKDVFIDRDAKLILSIPLRDADSDCWFWKWDKKGQYTVRSAYTAIQEVKQSYIQNDSISWKKLWNAKVPLKVKHFIWSAVRNILPTKDQLLTRRVDVNDKCPVCNDEIEIVYHVLVTCSMAKQYWNDLGINTEENNSSSFDRWVNSIFQKCKIIELQEVFMVCWSLWNNKNEVIWNQRGKEYSDVCKLAKLLLNQWKNAQDKSFDHFLGFMGQEDGKERWEYPQEGKVKFNVDAAIFENSSTYCLSMVARDHRGELVVAGTSCREGRIAPDLAEALGIKEALSWIKYNLKQPAIVETDCLAVVQAIRCSSTHLSYLGRVIEECSLRIYFTVNMAGGGAVSSSNGKVYPGKLTTRVVVACIVAAMGGMIFGYDLGVSGGVTSMDSFLEQFFPSVYRKQMADDSTNQYCKFDSQILTTFTSSLYVAALLSSLFVASWVTRRLGRKLSMLAGGILFCAGALINGLAQNIVMLIVGRILLGFGIGFGNQAVPLYLSEMAPSKYRGALNFCFQLSITLGILIANLVNYWFAQIEGGWGWRLSLGGAIVPALFMIVGSLFLPETPNSLIEMGKQDQAKAELLKIRGVDNVDEEFEDLVAASEASKKVEHPWRNLLQRKYRPHLVMAILIPFFQQITGINVIMFYAPVLFRTIGFGSSASLTSAVITGLVNVIATFVAIYVVDKFGRKVLFYEGGIQMIICQIIVAILIGKEFGISGDSDNLSKGYAIAIVAFICMYVAGFAWSWGPLGWLVPIMTVFVHYLLPETKGIPIEDMAMVWKSHAFWKSFVNDDVDDEKPKKCSP